jgi:hypothetical protein
MAGAIVNAPDPGGEVGSLSDGSRQVQPGFFDELVRETKRPLSAARDFAH